MNFIYEQDEESGSTVVNAVTTFYTLMKYYRNVKITLHLRPLSHLYHSTFGPTTLTMEVVKCIKKGFNEPTILNWVVWVGSWCLIHSAGRDAENSQSWDFTSAEIPANPGHILRE